SLGFLRFFVQCSGLLVLRRRIFVVSRLGYLEINLSSKTRTQSAIDVAGHGGRKVIVRIRSTRNYYDGEFWIRHRRVGSEQPQPGSLPDAGAGLTSYSLFGSICFAARAIVHSTDHARQHSSQGVLADVDFPARLSLELVVLF